MVNKNNIKSFLGVLVRISGLPLLLRELVLRKKNTIICYHKPSSEQLRSHLTYLTKRYNIISLDTLVHAIQKKDWSQVPSKSLVITFDDGLKENYGLLTVIREFKVPVTIFLCSHIVNTRRRYWFLSGAPDNQGLKTLPNQERLSVLKEKVGFEQEREYAQAQSLDLDQIREMSGDIDFQSHSRFHPVLTTCRDSECLEEIKDSKQYLEKVVNHPVKHFAYPNGNYGRREIANLRRQGYSSGLSMDFGWNDERTNPYCLKRLGVSDTASTQELVGEISGVFGFFRGFLDIL